MGKENLSFGYLMATKGIHLKDPSRLFNIVTGIDPYDNLKEEPVGKKESIRKYERRKLKAK